MLARLARGDDLKAPQRWERAVAPDVITGLLLTMLGIAPESLPPARLFAFQWAASDGSEPSPPPPPERALLHFVGCGTQRDTLRDTLRDTNAKRSKRSPLLACSPMRMVSLDQQACAESLACARCDVTLVALHSLPTKKSTGSSTPVASIGCWCARRRAAHADAAPRR